jgi:voltage-gated potassium channel
MQKRTNAFVLFGKAFINAKKDFWVSIQVLLFVSIGLALLFWWVEGIAQPDIYGGVSGLFQSFVWTITRYIGDPGHFAGDGPITLSGRFIDTFIGILKILIFAVPAGLVANGFRKAMKDDKTTLAEIERYAQELKIK